MTLNEKILEIARSQIGVAEIQGKGNSSQVMAYFATVGYEPERGDGDAWCGAGMGWTVEQAGLSGPALAVRARAWVNWGTDVRYDPQPGDIVVFPRGKSPTAGHVTMIDHIVGNDWFCVGFNQSDQVMISRYNGRDAIAVRRAVEPAPPKPMPKPMIASKTGNSAVLAGGAGITLGVLEASEKLASQAERLSTSGDKLMTAIANPTTLILMSIVGFLGFIWWDRRRKMQEHGI